MDQKTWTKIFGLKLEIKLGIELESRFRLKLGQKPGLKLGQKMRPNLSETNSPATAGTLRSKLKKFARLRECLHEFSTIKQEIEGNRIKIDGL